MEEYFDILDGQGNKTGEIKPRTEAHGNGLWHSTVHIYFYRIKNSAIEMLVHLRSKDKDLNPNRWDTRFGGHVKAGENIQQALANEMQDETGLQILPANLSEGHVGKHDKFPNREFVHAYFYNFNGEAEDLKFNDGEVQDAKWMSSDDIIKSMKDNPEQWTGSPTGFTEIVALIKTRRV